MQGTLELRPYQIEAVNNVKKFFIENKAPAMPVAIAGCGAGKTVIFAQMAWLAGEKNNRSIVICPYQSLLDQFLITLIYKGFKGTKEMYEIVLKNDPEFKNPLTKKVQEIYDRNIKTKIWKSEIAWYAGGKPTCKDYTEIKVIIAMAQTIESRGMPDVQLSLIGYDEWHLTYFRRELQLKLNKWDYYPKCREVGFTATPYHSDGRKPPEGTEFQTVITTKELIELGYNSPYNYIALGRLEYKYAIRSKDLSLAEETAVLKEMFSPEKSFRYLNSPGEYSENKTLKSVFEERTIFFFSRKVIAAEYIEYYEKELKKLGIKRELIMVCDETPIKERKEAYIKFRKQEAVLFTITALAIGFDEPSVENIVLHRAFTEESFALFIQIIGRGLRVSKTTGKTICRIYDLCANPYFPLPDEIIDWNIPTTKEQQKLCRIPIPKEGKECPHCGIINGRGMTNCYKCGGTLPAARKKTDDEKFEEWKKLIDAYTLDIEGVFKIDNFLLSKVRDVLITVTQEINKVKFDNQEINSNIFECLVALQRAVKGFIFKNDPLPVEKLEDETIKLSQLVHLHLAMETEILKVVVEFKKAVDKFLIEGETNRNLADRFLIETKEIVGTSNVLKFIERSSVAGQTPEAVYKILLKLAVLLYDYDPKWTYFEFKKLFPDHKSPPNGWRLHAIYGESPTYGNYLAYHHFLWSKYARKYGDNAHTQVYSALSSEFGKYASQFYTQFQEELKKTKAVL